MIDKKKGSEFIMELTDQYKRRLHCSMAIIGGFLGAYALINRADMFGNAQTTNLIYFVMGILGRNFLQVSLRLVGILVYALGIILVTLWPKYFKARVQYFAILVDMIVIIILGFLPKDLDVIVALYPIFFAMSVQWSSFSGVYGYNCSTIFSTNNFKQFTSALTEYLYSKDKNFLHKAKFYGEVILSYHFGVVISFFACEYFGIKGAWIGLVPAMVSFGIIVSKSSRLQRMTEIRRKGGMLTWKVMKTFAKN